jgi:hypothetical protein
MLSKDKTNLVVLLEPGQLLESEWFPVEESERVENLPISGIEDGGAVEPVVQGRLLDAKTGEPISVEARIIPGSSRGLRSEFIEWQEGRAVIAKAGRYELALPMQAKRIILQVMAEDYEPHISQAISIVSTNAEHDIVLKAGKTPSAILLGVDGKPASGVKVYCLGPMEQGGLNKNGEVSIYRSGKNLYATTDVNGRFKVLPKAGAAEIVAANAEGFVKLPLKDLPEQISLQAYGTVKGRLVKDKRPVADEMVDLRWEEQFDPQRPHLNLHGISTDENGVFEIPSVPPGKLKVTRREKLSGGGWTDVEIKALEMKPGERVDLGEVEYPAAQSRFRF